MRILHRFFINRCAQETEKYSPELPKGNSGHIHLEHKEHRKIFQSHTATNEGYREGAETLPYKTQENTGKTQGTVPCVS